MVGLALVLAAWGADPGPELYRRACAPCHGVDGDGAGPAAPWLDPPPRDFTRAAYKFRTTYTGSNPTDADIARTIRLGVPGTSMPAWEGRLTDDQIDAVVQVLKGFSEWFDEPVTDEEIAITPELLGGRPAWSPEHVAAGAEVYERMKCAQCHGADGRGNPDNPLEDDLGRPIEAFDFTRARYRGGSGYDDIYRAFTTGLDGTPMPSYDASLDELERWQLVYFVASLDRRGGPLGWLLRAPSWNHRRPAPRDM